MSALIQVEFGVLPDSLSKAFEVEMSKISGVISSTMAEQIKLKQQAAKLDADNAKAATALENQRAAAAKANLAEHASEVAKRKEEERQAAIKAKQGEADESEKVIKSLTELEAQAEKEIAQLRAAFSKEVWGTEKKAAEGIVAEISRIQEEKDKNIRQSQMEGLSKADAAHLASEKKKLDRELATMRRVALENEQIAEHGAGAAVGIMGIGRNIETIAGKASSGIAKMAGGLGLAAAGGMTLSGFMNASWEKAQALDEQMDGLEDTLASAGVPAEQIEGQIQLITDHAAEWGDKMNVPRDRVRDVAIGITGLTGLTGEAANQATELAIGFEHATGGILKAENLSKLLTKSIGDPENEKALKILEAKYPGIGKQMAAAATEQEKLNVLQQAAGPVFAQMEDRASGMWDTMEVGVRSATESMAGFLTGQYDNIAAATTMAGTMLPVVGAFKQYEIAAKASAIATKAKAVAQGLWNAITHPSIIIQKAVTAAQWLWNAALSANPIGIVVVAVGAFVGGLALLYNKSEAVRNVIDTLWKKVKDGIGWLGSLLGITDDTAESSEGLSKQQKNLAVAHDAAAAAAKRQADQEKALLENFERQQTAIKNAVDSNKSRYLLALDLVKRAKAGEFDANLAIGQSRADLVRMYQESADNIVKVAKSQQSDLNRISDQTEEFDKLTGIKREKNTKDAYEEAVKLQEQAFKKQQQQNEENIHKNDTLEYLAQAIRIEAQVDHQNALLAIAKKHKKNTGDIEIEIRKLQLELDKTYAAAHLDAIKRQIEQEEAIRQETLDRKAKMEDIFAASVLSKLDSRLELELHNAEVSRILEEKSEEEHQQTVYEIKRKALVDQLAALGENAETRAALLQLDRDRELAIAKEKADRLKAIETEIDKYGELALSVLSLSEAEHERSKEADEALEKELARLDKISRAKERLAKSDEEIAGIRRDYEAEASRLIAKRDEEEAAAAESAKRRERDTQLMRVAGFQGTFEEFRAYAWKEAAVFAATELYKLATKKATTLETMWLSAETVATNLWEAGSSMVTAAADWIAGAVATLGFWSLLAIPAGLAGLYGLYEGAKSVLGFREGGYTGDGDLDEKAGVVHKKEFVLKAGSFSVDKDGRLVSVDTKSKLVSPLFSRPENIEFSTASFNRQGGGAGSMMTSAQADQMIDHLGAIRRKDTTLTPFNSRRMRLSNVQNRRSERRSSV